MIFAARGILLASQGEEILVPEGETLDSGEILQQISWNSPVYAIDWSPDGWELATGSGDGVIHLWDIASGRELMRLRESAFQELKVRSVDFSSKGDRIAAAYDDGIVRVWGLTEGSNRLVQLRGSIAAWSLDGDLLAVGLRSGTVQIWNDVEVVGLSGAHQDRVLALAWNSRGLLASSSLDGTIRIWNGLDGSLIRSLEGHELGINSVAWNSDGTLLASASSDDTVRVWNIETGEQVRRFDGHQDSVLCVAWSADGEMLVSGSKDQTVRIWRMDGHQDLDGTALVGHEGAVDAVAVNPHGRLFASGSEDGTARVWALTAQKEVLRLQGQASHVDALAYERNGGTLAVATGDVIRTWPINTMNARHPSAPRNLLLEGDKILFSLAAGADATVAAGYQEGTVEIWKEGEILSSTPAHNGSVLALAFRPDAKMLASGSEDRSFILWELNGSRQRPPVRVGRDDLISALVFSPDGKTLAIGSRAGRVRRWDVRNPEEPREIGTPLNERSGVLSLAFPSSNEIWVLLEDETIHAWDPTTGRSRQIYRLPERPAVVALSPDGQSLASVAFRERVVRVESYQKDGWRVTYRLVGGAYDRRTWVACDAQDLCWRNDDGTLLLREDDQGKLSPLAPLSAKVVPQISLEKPPPAELDIVDGESTPFEVRLQNTGESPIFWLRLHSNMRSSDQSLIFYPPPIVPVLQPGEEVSIHGEVSVETAFENPKGQAGILQLEILAGRDSIVSTDSVVVNVQVSDIEWKRIDVSGGSSIDMVLSPVGRPPSRALAMVEFVESGVVLGPVSLDAMTINKTVKVSFKLPKGIDLSKETSVRGVVATVDLPLHRWVSESRFVGGLFSTWIGLSLSVLLVVVIATLIQLASREHGVRLRAGRERNVTTSRLDRERERL